MFRGHLRFFVLNALAKEDMAGYRLMKTLGEDLGSKPSPGSIYPILDDLKEKKLISCRELKRKKVYSITKQGKDFLKQAKEAQDEFLEKLRRMHAILGPNIQKEARLFNMVQKNLPAIRSTTPEIRGFMNTLMHKLTTEQDKEKIKSFLKEKTKELKSL